MKIEFRKVTKTPKNFELECASVKFLGNFYKIQNRFVKISGQIIGTITVDCDRCGDSFDKNIDYQVDLVTSDGIVDHHQFEDLDIIELDNFIDFDFICESEIESIKSDILVCEKCHDIENLEYEI